MFLINLNGKESIYEQIKKQITDFIKAGVLKADDKLPSVRSLASELGINPNTVQKAYQELEANGYIYTLNKKGAFVAKAAKDNKKEYNEITYILEKIKSKGISKKELSKLIDEVYKEV